MTYREKIIDFIKAKNLLVYKNSNMHYIKMEDVIEIENWSEINCKHVFDRMVKLINSRFTQYDSYSCPWCQYIFNVKFDLNCDKCNFGKRHGKCDKENSLYQKLLINKAFLTTNHKKYKQTINKLKEWYAV